ncbi:MAG: ATP-binding cassette domain-containing protein [Candidatus Latescibacteria bacterium]|nr:ATP-binding cassette domain-containing protein [Candidatus Latescibacterota bacterium]NIM22702.1 ATP-binding cassette domain-containing protein [Candidatus Latescibacterota bacterium]NIM64991.1 ATP-binding cassette domain-containing protein [Candidatus Latescibacterota bacterium]NIO01506.1 ATP-binding cassette domain-containing protein [Candidatus Latescibacterota bacterium]NIO28015.1 ATP-binding cassette domain-containing protein [Candidatus Latescibacterota bacterium]
MNSEIKPMVRLEQFDKWYGKIHAVKCVDLEVRAGEAFVLFGPNGSGKTTILKAACGLHRPSSGRVLIDGIDMAAEPEEAKKRIAYLPQRVVVPGLLTGRELLTFYAGLRGVDPAKIEETLEFVSLSEDADRLTREYSGGMVQRLGLGIAYLQDVPILLLDEPTLSLDSTGIEQFRRWIRALKERSVTVLFTTHIVENASQLADRVGVIVDGRLVSVHGAAEFQDKGVLVTTVIEGGKPLGGGRGAQ